jgi:hypothetical protein
MYIAVSGPPISCKYTTAGTFSTSARYLCSAFLSLLSARLRAVMSRMAAILTVRPRYSKLFPRISASKVVPSFLSATASYGSGDPVEMCSVTASRDSGATKSTADMPTTSDVP